MSYHATGFTPEQESQILAAHKSHEQKLSEVVESVRKTEMLRTVTIVATVGGFIYTMARLGELIAGRRAKKKESSEGVNW